MGGPRILSETECEILFLDSEVFRSFSCCCHRFKEEALVAGKATSLSNECQDERQS